MSIDIANKIKLARKNKNLRQEDIAAELGVSVQAVSRWECGSAYPDIELLPKLVTYLGISFDELFGMDSVTEGIKVRRFMNEYFSEQDNDEKIKLAQKYSNELPHNVEIKYYLLSTYCLKGYTYARERLDEMRKITRYTIEHTESHDMWRDSSIECLIAVEDENKLNEWLGYLEGSSVTPERALHNRHYFMKNFEKCNQVNHKALVNSIRHAISEYFITLSPEGSPDNEDNIKILDAALKIMDVLGDDKNNIDGWVRLRQQCLLFKAHAEFALGKTDEAYDDLENAIGLIIECAKLQDLTKLKYNTDFLDDITHTITVLPPDNELGGYFRTLSGADTDEYWSVLDKYRNDERYINLVRHMKEQMEALKKLR